MGGRNAAFFICVKIRHINKSKIFMKIGFCCKIGKKRLFFVFYAYELVW